VRGKGALTLVTRLSAAPVLEDRGGSLCQVGFFRLEGPSATLRELSVPGSGLTCRASDLAKSAGPRFTAFRLYRSPRVPVIAHP
jgi:hypothetical protein